MQIDPNSLGKGSALISISIILFLYKLQARFFSLSLDNKYLHFFIPVFSQLSLKDFEKKNRYIRSAYQHQK